MTTTANPCVGVARNFHIHAHAWGVWDKGFATVRALAKVLVRGGLLQSRQPGQPPRGATADLPASARQPRGTPRARLRSDGAAACGRFVSETRIIGGTR
jgi:hypothetical protein